MTEVERLNCGEESEKIFSANKILVKKNCLMEQGITMLLKFRKVSNRETKLY